MITRLTRLFPLWALLVAVIAYYFPSWFAVQKDLIVPCLILIMFGMGMTLTVKDFAQILHKKWVLLLGLLLQYGVMPLTAFLIGSFFQLSLPLLVGMVLVGSTAGGTASNVMCYLAKADVALSISMTLLSTLVAVVAMPILTWLYVGKAAPVPVLSMLFSVLKIVVLPVLAGISINQLWGKRIVVVRPLFPLVSMLAIVFVIGIVVALNQAQIGQSGWLIFLAVVLHNAVGLLMGFWVMMLIGFDKRTCRTMAIEVGMQNSGLSVALAVKYFSAQAAIPGALFSIWHNITGSLLASWWSRSSDEPS